LPSAIQIIGGGLAGCEAAWQAARAGVRSVLYEMRPVRATAAHRTDALAELVCSNSLKSETEFTAPWLLKQELRRLGSLLLGVAAEARIPGGQALTVDREVFAAAVSRAMADCPAIEVRREEATSIPAEGIVIIATGPLTSDALAGDIARLTGSERLYFYDAISPVIEADSIDQGVTFRASRYGKSMDGTEDYLNCPMDRAQYELFVGALLEAQAHAPHIADDTAYFEACLPVEELARRGPDTLRFGPMKPMGLIDPRTGRRPWAAVQLRQENLRASSYNMVGFQNYLRYGDQARVFRMIPGLERAEFLRYGQVHRNTYINAPALLETTLAMRATPRVFFAGQISGVEGYVESIATGLLAGRNAAALARGEPGWRPPRHTALGSLCAYICGADPARYQPANITFDLLPPLEPELGQRLRHDRRGRHAEICRRALECLDEALAAHA